MEIQHLSTELSFLIFQFLIHSAIRENSNFYEIHSNVHEIFHCLTWEN